MDMTTMKIKAIATNAKLVKEDNSCVFKLLRGCKQVFFNADANIAELLLCAQSLRGKYEPEMYPQSPKLSPLCLFFMPVPSPSSTYTYACSFSKQH